MLENLRARREDDERGFTLIELMVVVLIIAILIAIAIPTFLGAKQRAQDKAAQSSLRNALTNAKGIYTDTDSYTGATVAALTAAEPSLQFKAAATSSTGAKVVSVDTTLTGWTSVTAGGGIVMSALSASNTCYFIADIAAGPGTMFAKHSGSSSTACTAASAPAYTSTAVPSVANATTDDTWAQAW
jgi:type IV pilus assembly protein PilA